MLTIKQVKGLLQISNISAISRSSGVPYTKLKRWQSGHTQKFSLADFNRLVQVFESALKGE